MSLPPGVHVKTAQVATQGGEGDWYSYDGDIKFENVMVVDEANNKVRVHWRLLSITKANIYVDIAGSKERGIWRRELQSICWPYCRGRKWLRCCST